MNEKSFELKPLCAFACAPLGQSAWACPPSEAHTHPPGVGGESLVLFPDHAGVCALVDGVSRDADVVVLQRDVAQAGVFQKLPVFVPAER